MGQNRKNRKGGSVDPANAHPASKPFAEPPQPQPNFIDPLAQSQSASLELRTNSNASGAKDEESAVNSESENESSFERLLDEDREYERSVSRRMIVTWLSVFVLIALWWVASRIFGL